MKYVFDVEANGLLNQATKVWCIVLYSLDKSKSVTFTDEIDGYRSIEEALTIMSKAEQLIGHNVYAYDFPLLEKLKGFKFTGKILDTLLLSQLLNFDRGGHGLAQWGERFGIPKPKQEQWEFFEEAMLNRCQQDVEINKRVYVRLRQEYQLAKIPASVVHTEFEVARISAEQVKNGWLMDIPLANKQLEYLNGELQELTNKIDPLLPLALKRLDPVDKVVTPKYTKKGELHAHLKKYWEGYDFGYMNKEGKLGGDYSRIKFIHIEMTQHALIKDFLLRQGWKPTTWNSKKEGNKVIRTSPKLTEDSFDSIEGDIGKNLALHMVYSHRRNALKSVKGKTGWLNTVREDNRLECIPMTLGAATGRMRHRNLVNVPSVNATFGKELRQLFIAPPDMVLVGCDLASAQLRLLAAAMGDEDYNKTVVDGTEAEGTDIHSVNARIAGLANRKLAKTFIYGFLFGAGDVKTAGDLGIGTKAAKELKAKFLRGLPALGNLKDKLENQFERSGGRHIIAQDGRKIQVNSKHKVLNYLLQGNEAILTKNWMVLSDKRIKEANIDCKLLTVMHDEQNFECNPLHAEKLAIILEESATEAGKLLGFHCRMDGSSKIGKTWLDIH